MLVISKISFTSADGIHAFESFDDLLLFCGDFSLLFLLFLISFNSINSNLIRVSRESFIFFSSIKLKIFFVEFNMLFKDETSFNLSFLYRPI